MQKQILIKLQDNKFEVNFPNVGQIIDIEINKVSLGRGQYGNLVAAMSVGSVVALDLIDAFATFTVLIPDMIKGLNVKDLFELNPIDAQELVVQYKQVFFPWYNNIIEDLKIREAELQKLYGQPEKSTTTENDS